MCDAELTEPISHVRAKVRNIYGVPKTFMRLRALGVRTSRKRVARIMHEEAALNLFERIEVAYNRARYIRPNGQRYLPYTT